MQFSAQEHICVSAPQRRSTMTCTLCRAVSRMPSGTCAPSLMLALLLNVRAPSTPGLTLQSDSGNSPLHHALMLLRPRAVPAVATPCLPDAPNAARSCTQMDPLCARHPSTSLSARVYHSLFARLLAVLSVCQQAAARRSYPNRCSQPQQAGCQTIVSQMGPYAALIHLRRVGNACVRLSLTCGQS